MLSSTGSKIAPSSSWTELSNSGASFLNLSFFQTTNAAVPKMPSRTFTEDELALDDIDLKDFANSIIPRKTTDGNLSLPSSLSSSLPPLYTPDEKPFIDDAIAMNKQRLAVDYGWKRQSSDHYACKQLMMFEEGQSIATSRAEGIVHCSAELALANFWLPCTRRDMHLHVEKNGQEFPREVYKVVNNHHQFCHTHERMPSPFEAREFVAEQLWRKEGDGSFVFVWKPAKYADNPPSSSKVTYNTVRATAMRIFIINPLELSTCHVTFIQQVDPGGTIPVYVINRKVSDFTSSVPLLMMRYDRSKEVDGANATSFIKYVQESQSANGVMSHAATHSHSAYLTESTLHTPSIVDAQKELLKDHDRNWKTLSSSTRFQHMSVKFEEGARLQVVKLYSSSLALLSKR